jgi:hypothetical protein
MTAGRTCIDVDQLTRERDEARARLERAMDLLRDCYWLAVMHEDRETCIEIAQFIGVRLDAAGDRHE